MQVSIKPFEEFYYSGIGSRDAPLREMSKLTYMAEMLEDKYGAKLRSGNAIRCDESFQKGAAWKEVYLPWSSFRGGHPQAVNVSREVKRECLKIVAKVHPNPRGLNNSALALHCRNANIIMGRELNQPSEFVLYWNFLNKTTGGTWIATRMADLFCVPKFNMASYEEVEQFMNFLKRREEGFR